MPMTISLQAMADARCAPHETLMVGCDSWLDTASAPPEDGAPSSASLWTV